MRAVQFDPFSSKLPLQPGAENSAALKLSAKCGQLCAINIPVPQTSPLAHWEKKKISLHVRSSKFQNQQKLRCSQHQGTKVQRYMSCRLDQAIGNRHTVTPNPLSSHLGVLTV